MAGYIGSKASVVSSGVENKKVITATAGQTAFTGLTYSPNRVHVFQNGVRLVDGTDYTATDGNSLTLTVGASVNDQVVVVSYSGFQTSDTVSSSAGGTFTGDVNFTGAFTSQGIDDNADAVAITIDSSENVGIGTSSPSATLDVNSGTANTAGILESTDAAVDLFLVDSGGNTRIRNQSGSFIVNTGGDAGAITGGTEAMRIDASGNLFVSKTSSDTNAVGVELGAAGYGAFCRDSNKVAIFNRKNSDGVILDIQKDGSRVGVIGTNSSRLTIGNGDTGLLIAGDLDNITPFNTSTNASRDAAVDLGNSGVRFKDLYLSGGAYLGGTGSSNKLDDYEEGTFTPTLVGTGTAGVRSGSSVSRGKYTKVGNLVHFQLYVDANSWSTAPSGFLRIRNLPFSSSSTTGSETTGSVMHNNYNFAYTTLVYFIASGVNELRLYSLGDNVAWIQASIGNESMNFYITGTYATT